MQEPLWPEHKQQWWEERCRWIREALRRKDWQCGTAQANSRSRMVSTVSPVNNQIHNQDAHWWKGRSSWKLFGMLYHVFVTIGIV
jgi:hypothetical protein